MAKDERSDAELVAEIRAGKAGGRRAYAELVRRHQQWLVRILTYVMGNRSDAEDVAQEAFVRAYGKFDQFTTGDDIRPWLRVIGTRLAYNRHRAAATRRRYTAQVPVYQRADLRDGLAADEALNAILPALSYPYREILVLRYVDELAVNQIAKTLGIGTSAAKMRLVRAREQFLEKYKALEADDGE